MSDVKPLLNGRLLQMMTRSQDRLGRSYHNLSEQVKAEGIRTFTQESRLGRDGLYRLNDGFCRVIAGLSAFVSEVPAFGTISSGRCPVD